MVRGRGCRVRCGRVRGRGVRRRGGNRSQATASLSQVIAAKEAEKETIELAKEDFWKRNDHPPTIPPFTGYSKINIVTEDGTQPLDIASFFLDDDFYELLVTQTNLYANQYLTQHSMLPRYSRARLWKDVTVEEMQKFLAFHLLTGIIRKPEISQYWSTDPLLVTPIFNNMSRNHYQSILEFLHFNDIMFYDAADPDQDHLSKVRPLIEHLVKRFKEAYIPSLEILIDKELMLWKGRLGFKQYIPNKRCQFGIKYFSLCERSGYVWNLYVYLGKVNDSLGDSAYTEKHGKSGAVVPKLMSELYNKSYHVYMDNWYTSLKLFQHLESNGTPACGTAQRDQIMPPQSLHNESLKRGEGAFRRIVNVMML